MLGVCEVVVVAEVVIEMVVVGWVVGRITV